MMNSHLPNIRWLAMPSEALGEDWLEKSAELDRSLEAYGMDLAEEAVYLIYSHSPEEILAGQGQCLIARSVIGPKKAVEPPFTLVDWMAAPIWREEVSGETLIDLLENAQMAWSKLSGRGKTVAKSFSLVVRRKLTPDLKLEVETIFHE